MVIYCPLQRHNIRISGGDQNYLAESEGWLFYDVRYKADKSDYKTIGSMAIYHCFSKYEASNIKYLLKQDCHALVMAILNCAKNTENSESLARERRLEGAFGKSKF